MQHTLTGVQLEATELVDGASRLVHSARALFQKNSEIFSAMPKTLPYRPMEDVAAQPESKPGEREARGENSHEDEFDVYP